MRPRIFAAGAAAAALTLLAGPAVRGSALVDDGSIAAGSAVASGVFVTYYDEATFFEGATLGTADFYFGFATGDIDRSGSSSAIGAVGYSPFFDLPGAINALGGTNFDFEPILGRVRASIFGQPPKDAEASLVTPTDLAEAGTMEAHMAEGPIVEAFTTLARLEPAPATHVKSAVSRIKVAKVNGKAVSEASTILRSVSIAGLITFDSITLTSTSTADGAAGDSRGSVIVEGGSVAGTPIAITENGIQVADQAVPLELTPVEDLLANAGIELVSPSTFTLEPGGERAVATVTGPKFKFTSPQKNTIEIVLGQAIASSTRLAGFVPPALPSLPPAPPPSAPLPPVDLGGPVVIPGSDAPAALPAAPGAAVLDLSRLVLSDAKSVDAFAALYSALAVGAMLMLAGLIVPRRRSLLEERLR